MEDIQSLKQKIIEFLAAELCVEKKSITLDTDILRGLGVDGDDVDELMELFSNNFNVNLAKFRWYHHGGPEGFNPFWLILRPWWAKKTYIPVTVRLLLECIKAGEWVVDYPEHEKMDEEDIGY